MDLAFQMKRLFHVEIQRILMFMGTIIAFVVVFQYYGLTDIKTVSLLDTAKSPTIGNSSSTKPLIANGVEKNSTVTNLNEETDRNSYSELKMNNVSTDKNMVTTNEEDFSNDSTRQNMTLLRNDAIEKVNDSKRGGNKMSEEEESLQSFTEEVSTKGFVNIDEEGRSDALYGTSSTFAIKNDEQDAGKQTNNNGSRTMPSDAKKPNDISALISKTVRRKRRKPPLSISQMSKILLKNYASAQNTRPRRFSASEHQLRSARLDIKNAPVVRNSPGIHASVFRNVSVFMRSYELMEQIFKVYVYTEGERPIFHAPILRGIYASEGWFMKLLEENEKFIVRDPNKAHLFYIPFSSHMLRLAIKFDKQHFHDSADLQHHLDSYVKFIAERYPFWNRNGGTDHFLVACHDWAPKITKNINQSIRALCNADAGKYFKIGKDTTLPVTFVRTPDKQLKDLGGKPPSERSILAFFAGSMHGYVRPILLDYWQNKDPDMAIFGHLSRGGKGTRTYQEYMKSSKYCICAKGYSVHTPRVVESIMYECVPVILADNYVPPFFEVLNWEAFAVFVREKDIPNLRNILLSIAEQKYLEMQKRVKQVQRHFLWHRKPVKYDLFYMILHSVWYNRVFRS